MNEDKIETLLRKAPAAAAPAGLVERLKKDIRLPHPESDGSADFNSRTWSRRWLPAFALAALFISCLVVVGVQTDIIAGLKSDNEKLRASVQNLDQLRIDNVEYQRLLGQTADLEQLRKDNADLLRLRKEVARLQTQVQEAEKLRAANSSQGQPAGLFPARNGRGNEQSETEECINNLRQIDNAKEQWAMELHKPMDAIPTVSDLTPYLFGHTFPVCPGGGTYTINSLATRPTCTIPGHTILAEADLCANNLKQIGISARTWDGDNNDVFPTNYISMALELNNPGVLYCPGDKSKSPAADWPSLSAENISYPMLAPGVSERDDPNIVYAYCPIHHNYLMMDGRVRMLQPEEVQTHIKVVNGRTMFVP